MISRKTLLNASPGIRVSYLQDCDAPAVPARLSVAEKNTWGLVDQSQPEIVTPCSRGRLAQVELGVNWPEGSVAAVAQTSPAPQVGAPARDFRLTDSNGRNHGLAQYRGKTVVLEWNNPGCPYVQKHYKSGNMQRAQGLARGRGVVWLTVNSGAPGKQGHMDGGQANAFLSEQKAQPTAYLLDPRGVVGKAYAATTTPEMFVITPRGRIAYMGAIDDKATNEVEDVPTARNLVLAALDELRANKPVSVSRTRSYGCSVKYAM